MEEKRKQFLLHDRLSLPISSGQAFQKQWKKSISSLTHLSLFANGSVQQSETLKPSFAEILWKVGFLAWWTATCGAGDSLPTRAGSFRELKTLVSHCNAKLKCFVFKKPHTYF